MDPLYAGWLLCALGAAIALVATWLLYPRGREPGLGPALRVIGAVALALPFLGAVLGLLAAPLAMLPAVPQALATAFLAAALPEEAFKGAVVWWLAFRRRPVRLVQDGAFLGAVAGVAFGLVENLAYVFTATAVHGVGEQVAFLRTVAAAPGHAAWGAVVGHHLALAALAGSRGPIWRGLGWAALLHGGFDAALMLSEALALDWVAALALPVFMASVVVAFVGFERARRLDDRRLRRPER